MSAKNKLKAVGRGAVAAVNSLLAERSEFYSAGKLIECPHCGGTEFKAHKVLLNTAGLTLAGLDWLNAEATTLQCKNCGRIEWFAKALHEFDTEDK